MATVAFVIPHKGREQLLCQTLASIAAQEADVEREIIVVTQNPELEESTLAAAASTPLRVIHEDSGLTISALRNRGVRESDAPFLAFLDADIQLAPHWLSAMLEVLADDTIALASAQQVNSEGAPPIERIRTTLSNAAVDTAVAFLPGRNLLLRRSTFEAAGGFPEHLATCEDYYFTDAVARIGQLWYSSKATYVHLGEDKQLGEMFKKEVWRGQSNLKSLKGRKISAREWPSFFVPVVVCLAPLLALGFFLGGYIAIGILFLAAALAPVAAYVTRLYFLADRQIDLPHIIAFYGYYFPARAIGTIVGAFGSLGHSLHNQ